MTADMKGFLADVERSLASVRPRAAPRSWFRDALVHALSTQEPRIEPMSRTIRRVTDQLIVRSGERNPETLQVVRSNVNQVIDARYGEGAYDR